ncbi:MAG: hypothetical protein AAF599_09610 [Bacteroidota bacterium]
MNSETYAKQLRELIIKDDLPTVFQKLRHFLDDTPLLKRTLLQNARFNELTRKIHMGTISYEAASVDKNQIRASLLDIIQALENPQQYTPEVQKEIEQQAAIHISNSKNVITGNIHAGGNVNIDSPTTINTESQTSKNLRLFLFVAVPLLAIGGTYFWYQNKIAQQPLNIKVIIENTTPIPELPEPKGTLNLFYGNQPHPKENITTEAIYENIPTNNKGETLRLQYQAEGFVPVDTLFAFTKSIHLRVRRNDDLAFLNGRIIEEGLSPQVGIEGVKITINCCTVKTDSAGYFKFKIPLEHQRPKQQITISKKGYAERNITEPIDKDNPIKTYLSKK